MNRVKVVAVGDGGVGKTSMLLTYAEGQFPEEYVPTVFDNYSCSTFHEGKTYQIDIWDTAGQEEYDRLRPMSYPGTNVFLLCFSLVDMTSFDNVTSKWAPELRSHCPEAEIILVGTKMDQRDESWSLEFVGDVHAKEVAEQIGARAYMQISAMTNKGLNELFAKAIEVFKSQSTTSGAKSVNAGRKRDKTYQIFDGAIYKRILNLSMFSDESELKHRMTERETEAPDAVVKDFLDALTGSRFDQNTLDLATMLFTTFDTDRKVCIPSTHLHRVKQVLTEVLRMNDSDAEKLLDSNTMEFPKARYYDSNDSVFLFFQPVDSEDFVGECNIIGVDSAPKHAQYQLYPLTGKILFSNPMGERVERLKLKKTESSVKLYDPNGKVHKLIN